MPTPLLNGQRVVLIVSGGIAAVKSYELIRTLRQQGASVAPVLTNGAQHFVTMTAASALAGEAAHNDMFAAGEGFAMTHIRLAREADAVLVAPASAAFLARMTTGDASDLASALLLATEAPILVAPAMNVNMWHHPATRHNMTVLQKRGVRSIGPQEGALACGEWGEGRMAGIEDIRNALLSLVKPARPLAGRKALVTAGPTREAVDGVRFLSNRSSGKQGYAVAASLARLGAGTALVSGPVALPPPRDVEVIQVESAHDMLKACRALLPVDVAVCVAAVADWQVMRPDSGKARATATRSLKLEATPDILASLSASGTLRPRLVVGFAAESGDVLRQARAKRLRKGCDWIVANDIGDGSVFGSDHNTVHLLTEKGDGENWPPAPKTKVADRLAQRIAARLAAHAPPLSSPA